MRIEAGNQYAGISNPVLAGHVGMENVQGFLEGLTRYCCGNIAQGQVGRDQCNT